MNRLELDSDLSLDGDASAVNRGLFHSLGAIPTAGEPGPAVLAADRNNSNSVGRFRVGVTTVKHRDLKGRSDIDAEDAARAGDILDGALAAKRTSVIREVDLENRDGAAGDLVDVELGVHRSIRFPVSMHVNVDFA